MTPGISTCSFFNAPGNSMSSTSPVWIFSRIAQSWKDNDSKPEMRGEPQGEENDDHNMGVNDVFFDREVSSNGDENSEYSFLDEISTGVNFRELLATF